MNLVEVRQLVLVQAVHPPAKQIAAIRREPLRRERDREDDERAIEDATHTDGCSAKTRWGICAKQYAIILITRKAALIYVNMPARLL
ncbi:MAG TPA: hypothetical protein VK337_13970 [Xanthobacteraceae bacterium]|nr:hypothetical protein [Xanthobacteraceae bacterium]